MAKLITFEEIQHNEVINIYIQRGNDVLGAKGFTEHSLVHAGRVANNAAAILKALEYDQRVIELAKIAGYMHDIGNVINREDHAQSGGIIAFEILNKLGMEPDEIATVVSAIGNHDEGTGTAVNPVSAALILADKSDVRRSRVRNPDVANFDIHDRVNYAVIDSNITVNTEEKEFVLRIKINPKIFSLMDYFEIFLGRMIMSRRAADFLGLKFSLIINHTKLM